MHEAGVKEISEIREILEQVVQEGAVSPETADETREALDSLCYEASKHGLTPADVVRAVLRPLFEPKLGCDCAACKLRRGEFDHADSATAGHR